MSNTRGFHAVNAAMFEASRTASTSSPFVRHSHSEGTKRGGQIWAIDADDVTIRLHLEHSIVGTRVVSRQTCEAAGINVMVGQPVVCTVSGDAPANYTIAAVAPGRFVPGTNLPDEPASVAAGVFSPAVVE